jgi:hypothetical protein
MGEFRIENADCCCFCDGAANRAIADQDISVTGSSGCAECINPNGTTDFNDLVQNYKGYWNGVWSWGLNAPWCFYAPYYPQGYFMASVSLRCDPETNKWVLYVDAQALLSYVDIPGCEYQMATCYYGWEGVVSVTVDENGKFQGEIEVPLEFLYGSGEDCCGANCSITFKFN